MTQAVAANVSSRLPVPWCAVVPVASAAAASFKQHAVVVDKGCCLSTCVSFHLRHTTAATVWHALPRPAAAFVCTPGSAPGSCRCSDIVLSTNLRLPSVMLGCVPSFTARLWCQSVHNATAVLLPSVQLAAIVPLVAARWLRQVLAPHAVTTECAAGMVAAVDAVDAWQGCCPAAL